MRGIDNEMIGTWPEECHLNFKCDISSKWRSKWVEHELVEMRQGHCQMTERLKENLGSGEKLGEFWGEVRRR